MVEDPTVSLIEDFGHKWKIIPPKGRRVFPLIAILIQATDGDIVSRTILSFIFPDGSPNAAHPDFVYRSHFGSA
jgi:hypothetical protein